MHYAGPTPGESESFERQGLISVAMNQRMLARSARRHSDQVASSCKTLISTEAAVLIDYCSPKYAL